MMTVRLEIGKRDGYYILLILTHLKWNEEESDMKDHLDAQGPHQQQDEPLGLGQPDQLGTVRLSGAVGEPFLFEVECVDPEGFPTRLYRWSRDVGRVMGGGPPWRFIFVPTSSDSYDVHFICADGTGTYNSMQVVLEAAPQPLLFADGFESGDTSGWSAAVFR